MDELWLFSTGTFVIKRAMGILTSARCAELLPLRQARLTGNLRDYYYLCGFLPQVSCSSVPAVPVVSMFWRSSLTVMAIFSHFLHNTLSLWLGTQFTHLTNRIKFYKV